MRNREIHEQRGLALVMFVFLLAIGIAAFVISNLNANQLNVAHDKATYQALADAKAALVGYAITYDDNHANQVYGYLPCPDIYASGDPSGEGAQSICGNLGVSVLGRFPWKTIQVEPIKDGASECLWYAVSGSYKNNPKKAGLIPSTQGQLQVVKSDGLTYLAGPADPAVAIIFAAGSPLKNQLRTQDASAQQCGGNYIASNYLDTDAATNINNANISNIANAMSTFIAAENANTTADLNDAFNDKLMIVKRSDIFGPYCKKYAKALFNYVDAIANDCNAGGAPATAIADCTDYADRLNNCNVSCSNAAQTLIGEPCLSGLSIAACQTAIAELKVCHD